MRRAGDWLAILLLTGLPLVAFSPLTLGRALPFFGDVLQQAYPYRQLAVSLLASGELPLWNPFTMAGVPLLANIQVGALYPLHVLPFLVLPFDSAFGLQSVLPLVLAGLGMYAYLRSLGLLVLPALIGGVVFSFSGPVVHKLQLPPVLEMAALIPLLFWLVERACQHPSVRRAAWVALGLGLAFLAGYPQGFHLTVVTLIAYLLLRRGCLDLLPRREGTGERRSLWLTGAIGAPLLALVLLLTAEQVGVALPPPLLPYRLLLMLAAVAFLVRGVWRTRGVRLQMTRLTGGLALLALMGLGSALLAAVQLLPSIEFVRLSTQQPSHEFTGAVPALPLLRDMLWGGRGGAEHSGFVGTLPLLCVLWDLLRPPPGHRRLFLFFLTAAALSGLAAVQWEPVLEVLSLLPGYTFFRNPSRGLVVLAFSQAVLASLVLDRVLRGPATPERGQPFMTAWARRAVVLAVAGLTLLQLLLRAAPSQVYADPRAYFQPREAVTFLQQHQTHESGRFLGVDRREHHHATVEARELLVPNLALAFRLFDVRGYDPLQLASYQAYMEAHNAGKSPELHWDEYHFKHLNPTPSSLLDLLGVRYLLSLRPLPGFPEVDRGEHVRIYENPRALPRAFLVDRYVLTQDDQLARSWLRNGAVEPSQVVILHTPAFEGERAQIQRQLLGRTGVSTPPLHVASAGLQVGNHAHVDIPGQTQTSQARGYTLWVLHPETGALEQTRSFDTHGDPAASRALAAFLARVPVGRIVLAAVKDEASNALSKEAVQALRSIGAAQDLRGPAHYRWSHAVIGVKGARPGEALEAAGPEAVSVEVVGPPAIRNLASPAPRRALGEARVTRYTPHRITVETRASARSMLVLSEIFYPGWQATVDRAPVPVYRADALFRAVVVPPGAHRVEWRFRPASVRAGVALTLLGLVLVTGGIVLGGRWTIA